MAATKVSYVCQKVLSKTLTCAQVMDILMDQPTANEISHAQLHTSDGFRFEPATLIVNTLGAPLDQIKIRKNWEYDSHLHPAATSPLSRYSGSYAAEDSTFRKGNLMLDQSRIARDNKYNERTGLAEMPEIPAVYGDRYRIMRLGPGGKGKPTIEEFNAYPNLALKVPAEYVQNPDKSIKVLTVAGGGNLITPGFPRVPKQSIHTMFEDSESMVMHLTAALLSDAGLAVLQTLKKRGPSPDKTVGIFSKTAVLAVKAHFAKVAQTKGVPSVDAKVLNRKAEVNPLNQRNLTGTFTATTEDIDHIVVVLSASATNDLTVTTCFPSPKTTGDSIGTPTIVGQDIAEHKFGVHTKMPKQTILPTLTW